MNILSTNSLVKLDHFTFTVQLLIFLWVKMMSVSTFDDTGREVFLLESRKGIVGIGQVRLQLQM